MICFFITNRIVINFSIKIIRLSKKNIYLIKWLYKIIFFFDRNSKYLVPRFTHSGNNNFYQNKPYINFSRRKLDQILFKKGINIDKFICFFQRDEIYSKNNPNILGYNKNDIRNTDPKIYIKTINHFISKGYTVVRTGPKISIPKLLVDEKYFEISDFYDPELKIYFFKKCKFIIGSNSGALSIGWAFKKFIANSNSVTLIGKIPGFNNMNLMPKIVKDVNKDRLLNLDDLLKLKYFMIKNSNF